MADDLQADHASLRCPECGKRFPAAESRALPFCSARCRMIDLGQWLDERHGLPMPADESDESAEFS